MSDETFECPECGDEHPDEVGVITCDCGLVIETYDDDNPPAGGREGTG